MKDDKFETIILDEEELELMESVERGEWRSVDNLEAELAKAQQMAAMHLAQDVDLDLKITRRDLHYIKQRAAREGLTPQALAASVLHKYVDGQI